MYCLKNIIIFISLFFLFYFCNYTNAQTLIDANKGILDLTNWDLDKDGNVFLDGQWEFYWNQLLSPPEIKNHFVTHYLKIPGKWINYNYEGKVLNGSGYATLRIKVMLQNGNKVLALHIPEIMSASKIWVNDSLIVTLGTVGTNSLTSIPRRQTFYKIISTNTNCIDIVIQLSNFHHRSGGIFKHIRLGTPENIERYIIQAYAVDMIIIGCLLISAFYFLLQFILFRKDKSTFWFAICLFLIALRTITSGDAVLYYINAINSYSIFYKIDYLTYYLTIPFFTIYLKNLFPTEFTRKHVDVFIIIGLLFSLSILFLNTVQMSRTLLAYQIFSLIAALSFLFFISIAVGNKRIGAKLFLFGIVLLMIFMMNDILFVQNMINTFIIFPIAMFFIIIIQMIILAQRFTEFIKINENMAHELTDINFNLEKKIQEKNS